MSTTIPPTAPATRQPPGVPSETIFRLSVEQYHEMARAGILTRDDRVELLEGWLVAKMTKHPPHVIATGLIHDALRGMAPAGWFVTQEGPVTTLDSEPEPDLALIRGTRRDYRDRHPGPQDVALVVEVADASLPRDRTLKKTIYAR
ncbi:MAG TPA: Uma2 family endonuclease, partial [Isosphaeraceae bacterium]